MTDIDGWLSQKGAKLPLLLSSLVDSNKNILITIGRLEKRKGIDTIIELFPELKTIIPNLVYLIGGDGPYRSQLEDLIASNKLEQDVIMLGRISDSDKYYYFYYSDLFIMLSRKLEDGDFEGFGIVYLEANAFSKPVIGGDVGGINDAIVNKKTGFIVNTNNKSEIIKAISFIFKNKDTAKAFGNYGRERVENEFNWFRSASKLVDHIHEAIS